MTGSFLILLLPLVVMPTASMVVSRYGARFDVHRFPVTPLRLVSAVACYVSLAATVAWWHLPGIHATWAFSTLALFVTSLDGNLRLVEAPRLSRAWSAMLFAAMLGVALWVGLAFPSLPALIAWSVLACVLQVAAIAVLRRHADPNSPAILLLVLGYVTGALASLAAPHVIYHASPLEVDAVLVTVGLSAVLMGMGVMAYVLERTAEQLARTRDRIQEQVEERTRELEEAVGRLRELDRLKDRFLSTVSHELRTPLAAIRGYGEFLEDEVEGPMSEGNRAFVQSILEAAHVMNHKVDDLLDLAGISAGNLRVEPSEFAYDQALTQVAQLLRPILERRGQSLEIDVARDLVLVGDRRRIQQVLTNLIQNAAKFSPDGAPIRVSVCAEGCGVLTEVRDEGIGIPYEQLERVFEAFYQVDGSSTRVHGGIGMGLSIARSMVMSHGGWIDAISQVGQGSTFRFWLPLVPAEVGRPGMV